MFKCKTCQELKLQNNYLKDSIDYLRKQNNSLLEMVLAKNGVETQPQIEITTEIPKEPTEGEEYGD